MKIDVYSAMIIFVILIMLIVFGIFFIDYKLHKEVCKEFGGELTGDFGCRKNGLFYEIKGNELGFDHKVVRIAVEEQRE